MKGGIGWKILILALDRDPWKLYLMFLSREIDIKLGQIHTKIHIYAAELPQMRVQYTGHVSLSVPHNWILHSLEKIKYKIIIGENLSYN